MSAGYDRLVRAIADATGIRATGGGLAFTDREAWDVADWISGEARPHPCESTPFCVHSRQGKEWAEEEGADDG